MPSALIQTGLSNSTTIVIALVVLVLATGLMIFLLARSSVQRKEREARVRERMLEMEREAQFATAANRVLISRNPTDVALEIVRLLREYLSMTVLGVYSGSGSDAVLTNLLFAESRRPMEPSLSLLPSSIPASLVTTYTRAEVVRLDSLNPVQQAEAPVAEDSAVDPKAQPVGEESSSVEQPVVEENSSVEQVEAVRLPVDDTDWPRSHEQQSATPALPGRNTDYVLLLPWQGPFGWSGVIVGSSPSGVTLEALDPYHEPLARLTDRLAVALEIQRTDAVSEASDHRAARTTDFSRSLISCLDQSSPLDSIVREVTRLVSSDSAALWRVDEPSGMVRMVAAHGLKSPEFLPLPVGQGLAGNVAQTGQLHAIEDAPADPRCIFPREARESGIVSYLGAPLTTDGKALGVIEAHCSSRRSWSDSDRRSLESAAAIISELVKSTDSRGHRLRVENAYLGLSESLQRLRAPEEVKEAAVEVLGHALGASRVMVVEVSDQDKPEPVKQEYRQPSVRSAVGVTFGDGFAAAVAKAEGGQPIAITDSRERSLAGPEIVEQLAVQSELAAPIRVDGKTHAIIYVHQCDRAREWEPDEVEFAERVVRQLSLSLSNLTTLETALSDARRARENAQRANEISSKAPGQIQELEQKLEAIGRALAQSQSGEEQTRGMLARASALEAKARAEADVSRHAETEARQALERFQSEHKQAQGSAKQLLEINRLKSEFIVNAGREIEASLQSVLGLTELLERGSYGNLTPEQREAVHSVYSWARRIKRDVDWLVEYGSARSRRLETSGGSSASS